MSDNPPKVLGVQYMQPAFADIEKIIQWRMVISPEIAEHFNDRLREEIRAIRLRFASEIAESNNGRISLVPDHDASIQYSRPIYRHSFATSKTRRRDSTGRYNIYFTLSGNTDGKPNTLRIYRIIHAGSIGNFATSAQPDEE